MSRNCLNRERTPRKDEKQAFSRADQSQEAPTVVFAYTIKGWGLPFAGDALNHSMLLSVEQMARLQQEMGISSGREWEAFPSDSPEGRWCQKAATRLQRGNEQHHPLLEPEQVPASMNLSYPGKLSTQEAFGRVLPKLAELPFLGERIVTAAPDVAVSTHLSSWVSKVGVFSPTVHPDYQEEVQRLLRWQPGPTGQHEELRRQVLAGGYRLLEGRKLVPEATIQEEVHIATTGSIIPEAIEAAHQLSSEGIAANVLHITSPQKLFALFTEERHHRLLHPTIVSRQRGHLATLFSSEERYAPLVTVQDASSHSLAFLGSLYGVPTIPLGVDRFGQSGSQMDIYRYAGISVDDIVSAGYLALELVEDA